MKNLKDINPLIHILIFFVLRFDPKVICNDAQRLSVYRNTEFVMAKYRIKQSAEECLKTLYNIM